MTSQDDGYYPELRLAIKSILTNATGYRWSLQGFGMLRLYFSKEFRLHVWDSRYRRENVSTIHTHPWDFRSVVIAGKIFNTRYIRAHAASSELCYWEQKIRCGVGGGKCDGPSEVRLSKRPVETYNAGQEYFQMWDEIHSTEALDGTITLVTRHMTGDPDHASVFWDLDKDWVTAEPRDATFSEVEDITRKALQRFDA